jgi:hypothetical protein
VISGLADLRNLRICDLRTIKKDLRAHLWCLKGKRYTDFIILFLLSKKITFLVFLDIIVVCIKYLQFLVRKRKSSQHDVYLLHAGKYLK